MSPSSCRSSTAFPTRRTDPASPGDDEAPDPAGAGRLGRSQEQVSVGTDALSPFAMKPNCVLAWAASDPFQATLRAVTVEPLVVSVVLHDWVMLWPLGSVQPTVQPEMALLPAVTVTWAWKPPCHELLTW